HRYSEFMECLPHRSRRIDAIETERLVREAFSFLPADARVARVAQAVVAGWWEQGTGSRGAAISRPPAFLCYPALRKHPSLAPRRPSHQRRAQGRAGRLSRHARAALSDFSGLGAEQGRAAMAVGRADRGSWRSRVRHALRAYRAALDRTAGRASGSQGLARSALVARTRRRHRSRAGDAVRIDLGGAPHRHVCQTGSTARAFDLLARG